MEESVKVYKFRVKSLEGSLNADAKIVNLIWNYCNETQKHAVRLGRKWLTGFDLTYLTAGSSKELNIHSGTVSAICLQYARSRTQKNKPYLRFRGTRSLGWIPFRSRYIRIENDTIILSGKRYRFFKSREIPKGKICDGGCFTQDARGRWYVCIPIQLSSSTPLKELNTVIGVDLGLKSLATLSTGEAIEAPQHFRKAQERIGKAQRANKKRLVSTLHAKAKNARQDHLHKVSTKLVSTYDGIVVGDVSSSNLAKTRMAKSVLDAGWYAFKNMLRYKARTRGTWYEEVSERLTTQLCSSCGALPPERPEGIAGLEIRRWCCSACGSVHDRDVNAALNILARSGHRTLAEGISAQCERVST